MRWLIWLYPRAWRRRYGEEFLAALEEQRPSLSTAFDIILGAIDAHLHPQAWAVRGEPALQTEAARGGIMSFWSVRLWRADKLALLGFLFAAPTLLIQFVGLSVGLSQYVMPGNALFTTMQALVASPLVMGLYSSPLFEAISPLFFPGGPVLALLISAVAMVRISVRKEAGSLVGSVRVQGKPLHVGIAALSLLALAVLFLVRNALHAENIQGVMRSGGLVILSLMADSWPW